MFHSKEIVTETPV